MTPEQFQQEIDAFEILIIYGILKAEIVISPDIIMQADNKEQ